MDILYMGYFCNEQVFNRLVANGSNSSHARQQLETKLLTGLIAEKRNDSLQIISYLPEMQEVKKDVGKGEEYHNVDVKYTWCNKRNPISVMKALYQNKKSIKSWAKNTREKVAITYSVNPINVIPLLWLRRKYNYKVITLCSEISIFRRKDANNLVGYLSTKISSLLDNSFDGYILLTPYMNEIVNTGKRPYLLMEGIADEEKDMSEIHPHNAILYAGGLTEDNGIKILLEGFVELEFADVELWICGGGPLENEVKEYADIYENIKFYGIVPNEKVQQMERESILLISPRFSNNQFTKYSFPSKTIEYMSTGVPVVLTRLAGIPEEYFNYVYILDEETSHGVAQLIKTILSKSEEERNCLGNAAKNFVLLKKNSSIQAKRILEFAQSIIEYGEK